MQKQLNALAFRVISFALLLSGPLQGQQYTQTLKGMVVDKALKTPLTGATITLLSAEPVRGAVADLNGAFSFPQTPVGKHRLRINYLGYQEMTLSNITLNSGKETFLTIELEESLLSSREVVIQARTSKEKPLNELSTVSTRTFSVEETQRFAAAVNDPARMAASFAGVAMPEDGNNMIIIRGNAPNGLLWRMEGVDIPNPNHFSDPGSSGGGISILSAQLLSNSDFSTGAFAAEYGNALSGVFDLRLRKGNTEKREHTVQLGFLGLDLATEGPIKLGRQNGSYLVNYRYSTLSIISKLGVNIGDAVTNFQDLSFNVYLPAGKWGNFTVFGMGGLSDQTNQGKRDSILWLENEAYRYSWYDAANTGVVGVTHQLAVNDKTYMKTVFAASATKNDEWTDQTQYNYLERRLFDQAHTQTRYTLSSTLNHKFNRRHFLRAGAYANFIGFNFNQHGWDEDQEKLMQELQEKGQTSTLDAFAQWQYKPSKRLTLNAGMHGIYLFLNKSASIEPRVALKYALSDRQSISIGYGLHGQAQPLGTYFAALEDDQGRITRPNRGLGLSKSRHLVLSFEQGLPDAWRIKPELYFQYLYNVPVSADEKDPYSALNELGGFTYRRLENSGLGRNYGLELTIEKFLTRGFYLLGSSSLFDSEYRGSDLVWRNSRFNLGLINTLSTGKEWDWRRGRKNRSIGFNLKLTQMGGRLSTPIDLAASRDKGETVYDESKAFSVRMPGYFRTDVGFRLKRNYKNITTTLGIDIQNVSNRLNIGGEYFDKASGKVKYFYMTPLIPVFSYRVDW